MALPLFLSQIASGWRRQLGHNEQELGGTFPPSFGASGNCGVTHKRENTKSRKRQKSNNGLQLEVAFPLSFGAWSERGMRQKQKNEKLHKGNLGFKVRDTSYPDIPAWLQQHDKRNIHQREKLGRLGTRVTGLGLSKKANAEMAQHIT